MLAIHLPWASVSPDAQRMMAIGKEALRVGIEAAQPGGFLHDIGAAINGYADAQGVNVVHEWGGHGIGRALHEPPSVSHIRQPTKRAAACDAA